MSQYLEHVGGASHYMKISSSRIIIHYGHMYFYPRFMNKEAQIPISKDSYFSDKHQEGTCLLVIVKYIP